MTEKVNPAITVFVVTLLVGGTLVYFVQAYGYLLEPTPPDTITVSDYTGKVIQVDHISSTSGGLFFTSTRQDTYVTFDNGQTYWKSGYIPIVEGLTYHVHSVKTIMYGARAAGNGTLTKVENSFSVGEN